MKKDAPVQNNNQEAKKSDSSLMQKLTPFILPGVALLLVVALAVRWYKMKTQRPESIASQTEGVEIENLSEKEMNSVLKGATDLKTAKMKSDKGYNGEVKYDIKNGKLVFSVNADLPELIDKDGVYQVWVKVNGSDAKIKAMTLSLGKAGYYGSASIAEDKMPVTIFVSKEVNSADDQMEEVLLQVEITK